jgi:hypothetical protein
MSKEGRIVAIACMIYFMYGLSFFLQSGNFIFPFPLNELFFLIISSVFAFKYVRKHSVAVGLLMFGALAYIGSKDFYWNLFLNADSMQQLGDSVYLDIIFLLYYILLLFLSYFSIRIVNSKLLFYLFPIAFLLLILTNVYQYWLFEFSFFLLHAILAIYGRSKHPLFYLWILIFYLESTKYWSLVAF